MKKKIESVDVNFRSILQARFLADGLPLASYLDEWIEKTICSSKSNVLKMLLTGFNDLSSIQKSANVIEFNVDDLDKSLILFFLANINDFDALMNEKYNHHIKIYSTNSFVDAGYIELNSKSFNYHDTASTNIVNGNILFEYNPLQKQEYLESLNLIKNFNSNVKVISDDLPRFLLTSNFDTNANSFYYRACFIDPLSKRELPFNGFSYQINSSTELSLIPKSAEAVLQLSAAHQNGYWILFNESYRGKFYTFKIPELSDFEATHKLWSSRLFPTDGYIRYEKDMGYRSLDNVSLDMRLSTECSKLFNWFLPKSSEVMPQYINLLN